MLASLIQIFMCHVLGKPYKAGYSFIVSINTVITVVPSELCIEMVHHFVYWHMHICFQPFLDILLLCFQFLLARAHAKSVCSGPSPSVIERLSNTYMLNELLHKKDIPEKLRSQFVGTALLYIKDMVKKTGASIIDINLQKQLDQVWAMMDASAIRGAIEGTLNMLLDGSSNKAKKIQLLQKNVLNNQKVKALKTKDWREIFDFILMRIFAYINTNSAEGQDILNMFFIAFNKYTGKADKNQAFTPDHITDFMCRITGVNREKRVLDATCGSGSFLVQAMVKELADCRRGTTEKEAKALMEKVKKEHIYGIEIEENVFGLATTNMLIHSDGNSNVICENMFDDGKVLSFIKNAHPDIILMNPPYNAKPITISSRYKVDWSAKERDGKQDPTKGFVFVKRLADIACAENWKGTKMAVLLPMAAAIGNGTTLENMKS